ncbi:metallophosphoesterase [Palaeococcus ferrophilus]|uniref:metallophosphoesterase n=1 Tax=Palaeococcus ferrophilus TaxID=83868 RepID=UPI00064F659C|nr:metallophosphoesterase [Palaeococcus ferrophilus]
MKRFAAFLLALMVLSLVPVSHVSAGSLPYEIIKYPTTGSPAITKPGASITIQFYDGVEIQKASIISILHGPYDLEIIGKGPNWVLAKVPEDVVPESYFLQLETNKGEVIIPNGVVVYDAYPKVLRIFQVSDTHITSGSKVGFVDGELWNRNPLKLENPIPLTSYFATDSALTYAGMVDAVNLVVATGDVVDTAGDIKGYNLLLNIISDLVATGKPMVIIKGNHDDPPTYYSKLIGQTYFNLTIGKFLLIGLDSHGEEAHPDMAQLDWLESVLKAHPDEIPIVLVHHPFWYKGSEGWIGGYINGTAFDDASWQEMVPYVGYYWIGGPQKTSEDIARRFLQMVEKYNIKLVLSGHIHHDKLHIFVDPSGEEHWFVTLTTTGAPDKETNPPSRAGRSPTWYGSNIIEIDENGNVKLPEVEELFGTLFNDFISMPVPQEFMVFRKSGEDGAGAYFINEFREVSGRFVLVAPEGSKVDEESTDIPYKLLGERTIGDKHYMLFEVTVPLGKHQLVVSKAPDTTKPEVKIAYTSPAKPKVGKPFKVYFKATDNLGVKEAYVEIVTANGTKSYVGIPTKGDPNGDYLYAQVDKVDSEDYIIRAVAVDFHGNKAVDEKVVGNPTFTETTTTTPTTTTTTTSSTTTSITTTSSPTTTSTTPSSTQSTPESTSTTGGTCGPAFIGALALVPLLLRRRK